MGPGPIVAEAIFENHEEVPCKALYRDPVHDFGVLQYDPKKLKYMADVPQFELRPDLVAVGLDIRVAGNNAGEKLSVLSGTVGHML